MNFKTQNTQRYNKVDGMGKPLMRKAKTGVNTTR